MASKYGAQRKQENLKLAQQMMEYSAPSLTREGKQITIVHKGGRVTNLAPFKYDPHHIKKICQLNMTECRIIGLFPADMGDAVTQMIRNQIRNGFRQVKNIGKKAKAAVVKQQLTRSSGRGE